MPVTLRVQEYVREDGSVPDIAKALALHGEYKLRKKAAARRVPPETHKKR